MRRHFPRTVSKLPGWSMVETGAPRFRLHPRPIQPAPTGSRPELEPRAWRSIWPGLRIANSSRSPPTATAMPAGAMDQADVYLAAPVSPTPSPRRLTHLHGGVTGLSFSPDGLHIACLYIEGATRPAGALAPMKPPAGVIGVEGLEIQRVATIETASGEFRQVTPAALHVYEYDWAPDSGQLAYVAATPARREQLVGGPALYPTAGRRTNRTQYWTRNTHPAHCTDCRSRCPAGRRMGRRSRSSVA